MEATILEGEYPHLPILVLGFGMGRESQPMDHYVNWEIRYEYRYY